MNIFKNYFYTIFIYHPIFSMLLFAHLLFYYIYNLKDQASPKTCNSLLENETGDISGGAWTNNVQGFYSTIEALVGHLIDFYNVQFYNQGQTDYGNGQELIVASQPIRYTSICEMERFGHVPPDKVVVGKCTCDGCGTTDASLAICRGDPLPSWLDPNILYYVSPEMLSQSFGEVPLADAVGGVMAWKFDAQAVKDNNGLDFRLPLQEQRDTSAFYSDGKNTTSDVPRHVVYVNNWVSENLESWSNVFSKASSAGVNYILLAFYASTGALDATISWQSLPDEHKQQIKEQYPNTRLLLAFGGATESVSKLISDEAFATKVVTNLVDHGIANLYDGVDFDLENFGNGDGEAIICAFSYMTFLVKKLWPESIISHAPQAPHFGPLVETVDETNKSAIFAMFEKGRFNGCYSEHLASNHRTNIPAPDPATYQRPQHEPGILPSNYYDIVSQEATTTTSMAGTETNSQSKTTTGTQTSAEGEFECDCKCTCSKK